MPRTNGSSLYVLEQRRGHQEPFPLEMLAIDRCWPDSVEDVRVLRSTLVQPETAMLARVKVRTSSMKLSDEVWWTYGWSVR